MKMHKGDNSEIMKEENILYKTHPLKEIYVPVPLKFPVNSLYNLQHIPRRTLKYIKLTKGNNVQYVEARIMVLVHCTSYQ